jgi:hypothetical protein
MQGVEVAEYLVRGTPERTWALLPGEEARSRIAYLTRDASYQVYPESVARSVLKASTGPKHLGAGVGSTLCWLPSRSARQIARPSGAAVRDRTVVQSVASAARELS